VGKRGRKRGSGAIPNIQGGEKTESVVEARPQGGLKNLPLLGIKKTGEKGPDKKKKRKFRRDRYLQQGRKIGGEVKKRGGCEKS